MPHPAEASKLTSLGYNWNSAARQGRLYRITFKICRKCGTFHEERQHNLGMAGCLVALITFPALVAAAKLAFEADWGGAIFGAYLSMFAAVGGILAEAFWLRRRRSNSQMRLKACSKCAATEFTTIPKSVGTMLICPRCGTETMRCTMAGKS